MRETNECGGPPRPQVLLEALGAAQEEAKKRAAEEMKKFMKIATIMDLKKDLT